MGISFIKWVWAYFRPYQIAVVTPQKVYMVTFYRGTATYATAYSDKALN